MKNGFPVYFVTTLLFFILAGSCTSSSSTSPEVNEHPPSSRADPLPSWNEGVVKASIVDFVSRVTKEGSSDFIPPSDRIATFDNDGTLWAELPVIQGLFALERAKKMIEQNTSLQKTQPFKAIAAGDKEYISKMSEKELLQLVIATHTGMDEETFEKEARNFFSTAVHPTLHVPLSSVVYKPQTELLDYLRSSGFKVYICSGGSVEFMRAVSEQYYGIARENVIGTRFKYSFDETSNSIMRQSALISFDDKQEKPVNIQYHIGKRPVFACGNERSGGDIYMLRYSQGSKYPSFQLLINHDDHQREFEYQEQDSISLHWAEKYQWNIVSIKNDWKEVFVK
jgi:phosphoserine phosphatase